MFQIARSCQVEGHKGKSPTHICLFQECQNIMVCSECQQQGYHQHEQTNDNHVMDKQQFLNYFEKQIIDVPQFTNIPPEQIENNLIQINQIIDQAKELKSQLEQENQIRQTIKQIQMIAKQDFLLINKQQIIFINHFKQMLHSSSDKSLQIYSQLMNQFQQLYFQEYPKKQGFQEQLKENTNESIQSQEAHAKLINIQHQNYTKYYEFYQFTPMWALQISQDEQFLAFGSSDNKMNLLDLQNKQLIENNIKLNSIACICRFSDDSSLLFIGDKDGMLYSYNVHDQRLVYSKKTHNGIIYNIILIDNFNIITCSQDITIAVTEIQNDNIRRFQNIHNHHIYALDYDNQKDTIISGSWDKSIKVINRQDGLIIIQQENAHKDFVQQLQQVFKLVDNMESRLLEFSTQIVTSFRSLKQQNLQYILIL
ncbi:hypothetical protein pb186bvf_003132 [Paramecium bursaria]